MKKFLYAILMVSALFFAACSSPTSSSGSGSGEQIEQNNQNEQNQPKYSKLQLKTGSSIRSILRELNPAEDAVAFLPSQTAPAETVTVKYLDLLEEDVPVWQEQIAGSVATDAMLWRGLELSLEERDLARSEFASTKPEVVVALADRLSFLHEYYAHEEDYSFVTFTIPESRFDLVIPVLTGQTIGEEVLPFYKDSMDWYDGEELFSTDTVITKDIVLVQKE